MAFSWSKEQLQAIETVNKNILVSASAGAGKTTVLVARLMKRMLTDHISIDRIVAMTFTEAAASEMKKRLLQSLNDKLKEENISAKEADYCRQQLILLQSAHISTIHSFCLSIIKSDYALIGLNPARINTIFDDATVSLLKEKAFDHASRICIDDDPDVFTQLLNYFSSRSENFDELKKAVYKIASQAMGTHDPLQYLNHSLETYHNVKRIDELPEPVCSLFFDYCKVEAQRLEDYGKHLQDILFRNYPDKEKQASEVTLFLDKIKVAVDAAKNHDYREYHRALFNALQSKISIMQKAPDYAEIRKQINSSTKALVERTYSEETLLADLAMTYKIMKPLITLTTLYMEQYSRLKEEMEGIDFDDMEHFAYQILCAENGAAAQRYQNHFDEIMVDEFQDSNDLQNEIICRISRGNNVFRVGDIKQSIYRFRGAKPQIMRDLSLDQSENNCFIHLSNNFRSKEMIVDFNNTLFNSLMNIDGCSDSYTENDNVITGVQKQKEDNYPVEFHALSVLDLKEQFKEDEDFSANTLKAHYIAQQILSQHEKTEFNHWKDYVVLVRSHNVKTHLKQAFDDAGIPYFIDAKAGFYQSEAVQVLLAWFRILIDCRDNLSLSAILVSEFYQTTDENLAKLFLQKDSSQCLFDVLKDNNHPLVADYFRCRKIYRDQGLCALIDQLILINDFYEKQINAQQRTNCDLLRFKAEQFSLTYSDSLTAFLNQIDQISDEKTSEAIPVGNEDDVVKVMTIHQSKGLQFPVVFYWANSRIDVLDRKELCIADSEMGVGLPCIEMPMRYQRPTAVRLALEHKLTLEELEENIRILYVALTRAQNKMILVDTVKKLPDRDTVTINTLLDRKGTTDLILTAMNAHNAPYYKVEEIKSRWQTDHYQQEEKKIMEIPRYTLPSSTIKTVTPSAASDEAEIRSLNLNHHGMSGSARGIRLHEAVEQLPDTPWTPSLIRSVIPGVYDYEIDLLMKLDQQELFNQIRQYEVKKEFSFAVIDQKQLIHGQMDYVSFHDNEIWLIDFKSDRDITAEQLAETYAHQISLYNQALKQINPQAEIHAYLYSFTLNEFIPMN